MYPDRARTDNKLLSHNLEEANWRKKDKVREKKITTVNFSRKFHTKKNGSRTQWRARQNAKTDSSKFEVILIVVFIINFTTFHRCLFHWWSSLCYMGGDINDMATLKTNHWILIMKQRMELTNKLKTGGDL